MFGCSVIIVCISGLWFSEWEGVSVFMIWLKGMVVFCNVVMLLLVNLCRCVWKLFFGWMGLCSMRVLMNRLIVFLCCVWLCVFIVVFSGMFLLLL